MGPRGPRPGGPGGPGGAGKPVEKAKNAKGTIVRIFKYLSKFIPQLIAVLVLVCVSAVANLAGTYRISPIIDAIGKIGTAQGGVIYTFADVAPEIVSNLMLLAVLYFLGALANWGQSYILAGVSQNVVKEIRMDMFSKMELLPLKFFDSKTHGELMSRTTNDVDTISQTLSMSIAQIFSSIITLIGTFVVMLKLSPQLTLITLLTVPVMLLCTRTIAKHTRRFYGAQQSALGEMNGHIEETVSGEYAVKVFCHEEQVEERFDILNEDYRRNAVKAQSVSGVVAPLMGMFNNLTYAITAFAGGILSYNQLMSVGDVVVFLNYSGQFSRPINELANMFSQLQSALAGAERVFEIMDEPNEYIGDAEKPVMERAKGHVELKNVNFGYDEGRLILKDINIDAKSGETIALVGPTGAGKTTIVNLLTRFYDVNSGTISVDGTEISSVQKDSLRQRIAIVLQDTHMFSISVRENIRYGKLDASDEDVESAARLANAHEFIERLPEGYDTVLNDDATNISQGQRQLLSIARAMIADPDILILDEATSSVDTRTEIKIQEAMKNLMYGRTSFVIAHRLSTIREADKILVLVDGRIVEQGNHKELIALDGMYAKLYNGQFENS